MLAHSLYRSCKRRSVNAGKARFEMPIESTGDIRDNCDSSGKTMAEMRTTYNGHTHKENGDGGGITDKPGQPMS